ncbi:hypothetical protein GOODEAATRI_029579 [Goodea atripinnis]|uniref:Uncharacterized protein n=1 Tax=Goodea atripinnis TaxID=208336 RepID=A0ABV0NES5_9TELE
MREEDREEEDADEDEELGERKSNPILQKINGNGFAAAEASAGIRGRKKTIEDDIHPPHIHGTELIPLPLNTNGPQSTSINAKLSSDHREGGGAEKERKGKMVDEGN